MDWPENAMWCSGEITHDEIHGPFHSEAKAWAWVGQYLEQIDPEDQSPYLY